MGDECTKHLEVQPGSFLKGRAAPGNGQPPGTESEVRSLSLVRNSRNGVELKRRKGKKLLLDVVV